MKRYSIDDESNVDSKNVVSITIREAYYQDSGYREDVRLYFTRDQAVKLLAELTVLLHVGAPVEPPKPAIQPVSTPPVEKRDTVVTQDTPDLKPTTVTSDTIKADDDDVVTPQIKVKPVKQDKHGHCDGCDRDGLTIVAKGLCGRCYMRDRKGQPLKDDEPVKKKTGTELINSDTPTDMTH